MRAVLTEVSHVVLGTVGAGAVAVEVSLQYVCACVWVCMRAVLTEVSHVVLGTVGAGTVAVEVSLQYVCACVWVCMRAVLTEVSHVVLGAVGAGAVAVEVHPERVLVALPGAPPLHALRVLVVVQVHAARRLYRA